MNNTQTNIDRTQNTASFSTTEMSRKRRRKVRFKPNKEGMLALLALILIVAIVVTALVFALKGIITAVNESKETTTDPGNNPPILPWNSAYTNTTKYNIDISSGDLILVNAQNSYSQADTLNSRQLSSLAGYEGHSTYYVLFDNTIKVRTSILPSLKQMIFDMVDANPETLGTTKEADRLYIYSGYRNTEAQTSLNTNKPSEYPEAPGYSEHHTGYAFDLKIFSKDTTTISMRDAEYKWLEENCAKYGFIIRYDSSKAELTGIVDEPHHLRYVGVPHATYMNKNNYCLEEYLELLRNNHSYDKTPLEITAGEKEYLVYYVAANTADGATFTSIPVPPETEGTYTISGDNMNGFIVTVEKAAK